MHLNVQIYYYRPLNWWLLRETNGGQGQRMIDLNYQTSCNHHSPLLGNRLQKSKTSNMLILPTEMVVSRIRHLKIQLKIFTTKMVVAKGNWWLTKIASTNGWSNMTRRLYWNLKFLKFFEFSAVQLHIVCELHVNYTILYMNVPSFKTTAP